MATDYAIYRQLVTQLMQGEEVLPSLPNITFQIRSAIHAPNTTNATLEQLISRDPSLSALLMKHASCALYKQGRPAQNLRDVITLLGMEQIDNITMAHSLKSLFILYSPSYKRIFVEAWRRLVQKAATTSVMATHVGRIPPEHAILASLLSEVGSLVLLSVFRNDIEPPNPEYYGRLCKEFSKSLGVLLLKHWQVDEEYIQVIRQAGEWQTRNSPKIEVIDLVNLSLHQAILEREPEAAIPPLIELPAYQKLQMPYGRLNARGRLCLIDDFQTDITNVARTLRS